MCRASTTHHLGFHRMGTSTQIDLVQVQIRLLRREFERYFAGANDLPPREMEMKVLAQINSLKIGVRSAADRFRVSTLEASFSSYREMYGRKVRDLEEGRIQKTTRRPSSPVLPDVFEGVRVKDSVSPEAALSLYRALYSHSDAPPVGLQQFQRYLGQQLSRIRDQTGCEGVVFRLTETDGKRRLKAKPIR